MALAFNISPPLSPTYPGECARAAPSDTDLVTAMAHYLRTAGPASGADALRALRRAFPDSPLTTRVAALAMLARR